MTEQTRKIRNYLRVVEDIVLVVGGCEDDHIKEQAAFRVKGFARRIEGERLALTDLQNTLHKIKEHEQFARTILEDFPQLEQLVRGK